MENPDYSQGYIVKTCSVKETSFAYHGMKKIPQGTHDFRTSFKYVVYSPIAPRNNLFDFIPQDIKHYPILTFEEFKEKILNIKTMSKKTTIKIISFLIIMTYQILVTIKEDHLQYLFGYTLYVITFYTLSVII